MRDCFDDGVLHGLCCAGSILVRGFPVHEEFECGEPLDVEFGGERAVVLIVCIAYSDFDDAVQLFTQLFHLGSEVFAVSAPGGLEFDEGDLVFLDKRIEIGRLDFSQFVRFEVLECENVRGQ